MAGFFSKKQYAAMADKELAIKLLNDRCLECSICAMFFSSSLTVSIKALFLSKILSAILISEFFISTTSTTERQPTSSCSSSSCSSSCGASGAFFSVFYIFHRKQGICPGEVSPERADCKRVAVKAGNRPFGASHTNVLRYSHSP